MRRMKKLVALVLGLTIAGCLLPSSAPASRGAVQVSLGGSDITVSGTKRPDHIRIGRRPDGGNYVIEADRTIRAPARRCEVIKEDGTVVECRAPGGRLPLLGVHLNAGADGLRIAAETYAPLVVFGGFGADEVIGGDGADILETGGGDDVIQGRGGSDFLGGRGGADRLNGGNSTDALDGGAGKDRCLGGPGRDRKRRC